MSHRFVFAFILQLVFSCVCPPISISRARVQSNSSNLWNALMCSSQTRADDWKQLILVMPHYNMTDTLDSFLQCTYTPLVIIGKKDIGTLPPQIPQVTAGSECALILLPNGKEAYLKASLSILPNNPQIHIWVVLTAEVEAHHIENAFKVIWNAGYVNGVVLRQHLDQIFFYRYYPFSDRNCQRTGPPVLVIRWTPGTALPDSVYRDYRIMNFHGCNLSCGTFNHPPAVAINKSKQGFRFKGVIPEILRILSQNLDFSCRVSTPSDGNDWGYTFPNGSSYGIQGDVIKGVVDLAFGDFLQSLHRWQSTDMIKAYREDCLTILVPSGLGDTQYVWSVLTYEFSVEMWVFLVLAIVGCVCFAGVIIRTSRSERLWSLTNSMTKYVLMTFFGTPMTVRPESAAARSFFSMWFLFSMVVWIAYLAAFSSLVTLPWRPKDIDTLESLVKANFTVYTYPTLLVFVSEDDDLIAQRIVLNNSLLPGLLAVLAEKGNHAIMFPKISLNFALAEMNKSVAAKFHVFKDYCVSRTMVSPMLTKKGSPFTGALNGAMQRIIESGLVVHWLKAIPQNRRPELGSAEPFSLQNVISAFVLYAIGISCALVVFIIERFSSQNSDFLAMLKRNKRVTN